MEMTCHPRLGGACQQAGVIGINFLFCIIILLLLFDNNMSVVTGYSRLPLIGIARL